MVLPLALAGFRVPLWARVEGPVEAHAMYLLIVVQVVASSLLFPWLLEDGRVSGLVILSSGPLIQLAGWMGDESLAQIGMAAVGMYVWMLGLLLLSKVTPPNTQLIAVAMVSTAAIGGMIQIYLRTEFADLATKPLHGVGWLVPGITLVVLSLLYAGVLRLLR